MTGASLPHDPEKCEPVFGSDDAPFLASARPDAKPVSTFAGRARSRCACGGSGQRGPPGKKKPQAGGGLGL